MALEHLAAIRPETQVRRRALSPEARRCADWTERQHHVAGPLGVELLSALCASGWLRRGRQSRAAEVLPKGRHELRIQLGVDVDHIG